MSIAGKGIDKWFELLYKKDMKRIASQTTVGGVEQHLNVVYIGDSKTAHLMDIFLPEGTTSALPVIFDIHGGAWVYGSKEINKNFCCYLASKGFAVVSINYTLAPFGTIREMLEDIFYALQRLEREKEKYFLNLDELYIAGDSAGGQLALLTAAVSSCELLQKIYRLSPPSLNIRAVGAVSPAHDMSFITKPTNPLCAEFARRIFGEDYENSPYLYCASLKDIITNVTLPPVFISSSVEDFLGSQSVSLDRLLTKHGVEHRFVRLPKGGAHKLEHVYSVLYPEWEESKRVNDSLISFFKQHGGDVSCQSLSPLQRS